MSLQGLVTVRPSGRREGRVDVVAGAARRGMAGVAHYLGGEVVSHAALQQGPRPWAGQSTASYAAEPVARPATRRMQRHGKRLGRCRRSRCGLRP